MLRSLELDGVPCWTRGGVVIRLATIGFLAEWHNGAEPPDAAATLIG